mgnify:CR=1 FL=1
MLNLYVNGEILYCVWRKQIEQFYGCVHLFWLLVKFSIHWTFNADLMEVTMGDVDDQMVLTIDKQAEKWEAMEQEQHVWNAIDEERK